jgi:hypothetical protein
MVSIVGFEGGADDKVPLTYGAAALQDGERILNPVTKMTCSIEDLSRLVEEGHVTSIESTNFSGFEAGVPYYLLRVDFHKKAREEIEAAILALDLEVSRWIQSTMAKDWALFLFRSFEELDRMAKVAAASLRTRASLEKLPSFVKEVMLRDARVLDPYDGKTKEEYLDALRKTR